jgi:hypothetical protein
VVFLRSVLSEGIGKSEVGHQKDIKTVCNDMFNIIFPIFRINKLTTNQDVATASVFNAQLQAGAGTPAPTLQGFDVLTGTAGSTTNSLNIIDGTTIADHTNNGDQIPVGLTMSNIQNINLTTSNNAGADNAAGTTVFDVSGITGLTSLVVKSYGTNGDNIKAAATTNVTDTYGGTTGAHADIINVVGGNNVTVTDSGSAGGVTVGGGTTATDAAGTVTVTENGNGAVTELDPLV